MTPAPKDDSARRSAHPRSACLSELAHGTGRFHEPRRPDCPWCGSERLRTRLRTTDLLQRKPGTFVVEQCHDCAHAFQNPRLSPEGLDFYHRDFHDALGDWFPGGAADRILGTGGVHKRHLSASRAMLRFPEPESWLDVGTGYGHFPAAAREVHPYTAFDGLDHSERVLKAQAAGRVEEAHRGRLTELAGRLAGRYDVVSMFHHLEHSADPREELRAATTVLRPGGHLLIEVPDPDCAFSALLGRWWLSYFQPQHLHLMPLRNLLAELESLGYAIAATDRREPHTPADLAGALALAIGHHLPAPDAPWLPGPMTARRRRLRSALLRATSPLLASAAALDHILAPVTRRTRFSNAYRVIARRTR